MSFSNVTVRLKTGGWKMLADVEGNLTITLRENIFFDEEYILLLELAVALIRWVKKEVLHRESERQDNPDRVDDTLGAW